jgi:hypothetical protein
MHLVTWVAEASTRLVRGPGASMEAGATAPKFFCICVVASGRLGGGGIDTVGARSRDRRGRRSGGSGLPTLCCLRGFRRRATRRWLWLLGWQCCRPRWGAVLGPVCLGCSSSDVGAAAPKAVV